MTDTDHDKIIRMEEKIDNITKDVGELKKDFCIFKNDYRKSHESFQKEMMKILADGMSDVKKSAVKYADNAVTSKFRDLGSEMFAEKRVQSIVYGTIKVILLMVLASVLAVAGFNMYG